MNPLTRIGYLGGLILWLVNKWIKYSKAATRIKGLPRRHILFGVSSPIGALLPYIPYISSGGGGNYGWAIKHRAFNESGSGVYGILSFFPSEGAVCVSDPEVAKQISSGRGSFKKSLQEYEILRTFGNNLIVAEGEDWKRQRRICAPAFSDKNNRLVWTTANGFMDDMLGGWAQGEPVHVRDACEDLAIRIALCVIAKAGFGQDVEWEDTAPPPAGHTLTFKQSLTAFSEDLLLPLFMPAWGWCLRKHWRYLKQANDELRVYIHEMIQSRRSTQGGAIQHDLFSRLVDARDEGEGLSEDELVGNILIFLVAGHETTAHALATVLALMALYPEEQVKLVQQIHNLQGDRPELTYDDMRKLTYATAIMYEALRLYPAVPLLPKVTHSDTTLIVGRGGHDAQVHHMPSSTRAFILTCGLHYNPSYWDDPEDFVPSRFIDTNWNYDAFIPFSLGPRACIGRRFGETTIIAMLVKLISKYRVSVDETRFKPISGESILDRRQRLLNPTSKVTLTPAALPLIFTPRM